MSKGLTVFLGGAGMNGNYQEDMVSNNWGQMKINPPDSTIRVR